MKTSETPVSLRKRLSYNTETCIRIAVAGENNSGFGKNRFY